MAQKLEPKKASKTEEDDIRAIKELGEKLASVGNGQRTRIEMARRFTKWMEERCTSADNATKWLEDLPAELLQYSLEPHFHAEREKLQELISDAHQALKEERIRYLLSSGPEDKWKPFGQAQILAEVEKRHLERFLKEAVCEGSPYFLSEDRVIAASMLLCCNDRMRILDKLSADEVQKTADVIGVSKRSLERRHFIDTIAFACTRRKEKPHLWTLTQTPLPTNEYLERLHRDSKVFQKEFGALQKQQKGDKLVSGHLLCFRAVMCARLYDWTLADLLVDASVSEESARHQTEEKFRTLAGITRPMLFRLRALGHFIHSYPVLAFQRVLTKISESHGWENSGQWSVSQFRSLIQEGGQFEHQLSAYRSEFAVVIFPEGHDGPCMNAIPRYLRADTARFKIAKSSIAGTNMDGLFAISDMAVGTSWPMGGQVNCMSVARSEDWDMEFDWDEMGLSIGVDFGDLVGNVADHLVGWKANEPPPKNSINAVYLSCNEGVYLTVCRPVKASPEHPVEIFVHYGGKYPRSYPFSACCNDYKQLEDNAIASLKVVYGLKRR